jgi:hypothetical protein
MKVREKISIHTGKIIPRFSPCVSDCKYMKVTLKSPVGAVIRHRNYYTY